VDSTIKSRLKSLLEYYQTRSKVIAQHILRRILGLPPMKLIYIMVGKITGNYKLLNWYNTRHIQALICQMGNFLINFYEHPPKLEDFKEDN